MLENSRLQSVAFVNGEASAFQAAEIPGASLASGITQATTSKAAATQTVALSSVRLRKLGYCNPFLTQSPSGFRNSEGIRTATNQNKKKTRSLLNWPGRKWMLAASPPRPGTGRTQALGQRRWLNE